MITLGGWWPDQVGRSPTTTPVRPEARGKAATKGILVTSAGVRATPHLECGAGPVTTAGWLRVGAGCFPTLGRNAQTGESRPRARVGQVASSCESGFARSLFPVGILRGAHAPPPAPRLSVTMSPRRGVRWPARPYHRRQSILAAYFLGWLKRVSYFSESQRVAALGPRSPSVRQSVAA